MNGPPTDAAILDAWERARTQTPAGRALTILHAARPDKSPDALGRWTVGRRESALVGPRVMLRPLEVRDHDAWREIRMRSRDWLERWEPLCFQNEMLRCRLEPQDSAISLSLGTKSPCCMPALRGR